jgi:hypothetical protein
MGYYIQTGSSLDKAEYLVNKLGGKMIAKPSKFEDIPEDKALIVVVDNLVFEAAGLAYSKEEFDAFVLDERDDRLKWFILLDKKLAYEKAGYAEPNK